jgi:hypothetical protein
MTKCSRHPNVETNLRCSKCETPICPRCMVYTPVGPRCPECAAVKRTPIYDVSPTHYARALGAGLGVAIVGGFIWAFVGGFAFMFSFLIALGLGYAVGEAISTVVNRKRGLGLQVIAGVSVLVAFVVRSLVPTLLAAPQVAANMSLLVDVAGRTLLGIMNNPLSLIFVGIAVFVAVRRL